MEGVGCLPSCLCELLQSTPAHLTLLSCHFCQLALAAASSGALLPLSPFLTPFFPAGVAPASAAFGLEMSAAALAAAARSCASLNSRKARQIGWWATETVLCWP